MILLTGATGYLGTLVLARLLDDPDGPEVLCPVRARDDAEAARRLDDTLARLWHDPGPGRRGRVRAVAADLLQPLDLPDVHAITQVLHCAAAVSFDLPLADARAVNVGGARNVLDVARRAPRLERVVHVSTAYVAGRHEGVFGEDDLEVDQTFRNTYERTKHEAELLVAGARDLPVVVARPSIVVGEAASGWTTSFNVLYPPLRAYRRGMLTHAPADPDGLLDVVTGDYVADALIHLLDHGAPGRRYHLVSGPGAPTARAVGDMAAAAFGLPPIVMEEAEGPGLDGVYVPYFDVRVRFDDARAAALLRPAGIAPADLGACFGRLMAFADGTRWGKRPAVREDAVPAAA